MVSEKSSSKALLAQYGLENEINRITLMGAQLLRAKGHKREAIAAFEELMRIEPGNLQCLQALSDLHRELGDRRQSKAFTERYYQLMALHQGIDLDANPELLAFYLASEGFGTAPSAPPKAYIEGLFDRYASTFEQSLVDRLQYQVPDIITSFLYGDCNPPKQSILDLGCGTGLIGEKLRHSARVLDGVDLSKNMLDICRAKAAYDSLYKADIHDFLNESEETYELIVAMDVFNYLGDLQAVLTLCRSRQSSNARLAFTVEAANSSLIDTGYHLTATPRYQHTLSYVEDTVKRTGYQWHKHQDIVLRQQQKRDVKAFLVLVVAD